ncbi:MAG TPA: type IV toxin-antitoxin system AbiEi family antitoxin domain-containing protein [Streptosporangiaceae bacterium]|nr:type IV toxin-antitoxin system AbiEi family antitoxin domain-containing protein [Streptosporangiaceae bacterium]
MSVAGGILDLVKLDHLPETGRLANIATLAEVMSAGISAKQIRTMVSHGELTRLGHGVYGPADSVKSIIATNRGALALRAAATLATLGPHAVASHHTAAQLLGLALLGRAPAGIAITRAPGTGTRAGLPGVRVHNAALPEGQVGLYHGVPVTTAARTVADLARCSSLRAGVVVADSALRLGCTTLAELESVVTSCRRWPGVQRAAEVVAFADELAESPLESIARVAFRDCGLPPPQLQALLGADGQIIARVDFYWARFRTIAEADGELKYDNKFAATHQLRRDADLRDAGFEVVHFGWHDIHDAPAQVAESIRSAFRRGIRTRSAAGHAS